MFANIFPRLRLFTNLAVPTMPFHVWGTLDGIFIISEKQTSARQTTGIAEQLIRIREFVSLLWAAA